jgi:hypothetical protein
MSTYTPIATQTLSSAASAVIFSSIPQNYTDLILVITGTSNNGSAGYVGTTFNGDTTGLYSTTRLLGEGTPTSDRYSASAFAAGGTMWGSRGTVIQHLLNYSNSTINKTFLTRDNNAGNRVGAMASLYRSTNAIRSISSTCPDGNGFASGTTFSLYGITSGQVGIKATGGIVTTDATYAYHTFTSSGSFIPDALLSADVLVVAGGGGGGTTTGGGGGAGGLRLLTSQTISAPTTVIVGSGGSGTARGTSYLSALSGTSSSVNSISVSGGGGGGNDAGNGATGGSGGGGGGSSIGQHLGATGNFGGYSPVEGFGGGNSHSAASPYASGGGGGAGGAGNNAPNASTGGAGGAGTNVYNSNTFTSWLTATGTGVSGYLAGGGGGGVYISGTGGAGGTGGGGAGGSTDSASGGAGTMSSGSGGGGGRLGGGNGGSGLVIIRYLKA